MAFKRQLLGILTSLVTHSQDNHGKNHLKFFITQLALFMMIIINAIPQSYYTEYILPFFVQI